MGLLLLECVQYVARCVLYHVYKLVWHGCQLYDRVPSAITTRQSSIPHESRVEVRAIICRMKLKPTAVASSFDFSSLHEKTVNPEYLLQLHVSLYCIDTKTVTFVETIPEVDVFKLDSSPFQYNAQFKHATKVIRLPIALFHRLAKTIGDLRLPVFYIANTGRCGSTLLARMLEQVPGNLVHSEPDALTNLAILKTLRNGPVSQYEQLLSSTIRFLCKPIPGIKRVIIKPRSSASVHIDVMAKQFSDIQFLFSYRNTEQTILSYHAAILHENPLYELQVYLTNEYFQRQLCDAFIDVHDIHNIGGVNPKDMNMLDLLACFFAHYILNVKDFKKQGGKIHTILYEDMITNPYEVCSDLFAYLQISESHVSMATKVLAQDSQEGTFLSRKQINKRSRRSPISACQRESIDRILNAFSLPTLGEDVYI